MSDKIKGCTVAFDKDYKQEDAEKIKEAILMIKGIRGVSFFVTDPADYINRTNMKHDIFKKLMEIISE